MRDTIIDHTARYVRQTLATAEGGHDWWHIQRVWLNAQQIAAREGGHRLVVELGALLHDIADAKFHQGDEEEGPRRARAYLESQAVEAAVVEAVVSIVRDVSFRKGAAVETLELAIVQDADRLDALGAVGIARAFSYGGFANQPLHDPTLPPPGKTTINHFYEKLLRLKDRMNTETGKQMAAERHQFMEQYLAQFFREVGREGDRDAMPRVGTGQS